MNSTVCHLGDLGQPLTANQIEEIGSVDVLLIPVGGGTTISASQAAALVRSMEPKIVIPMHYKTPALTKELDTVDKFLKEMGLTEVVPGTQVVRQQILSSPHYSGHSTDLLVTRNRGLFIVTPSNDPFRHPVHFLTDN